jgi:hypothetical protein
LFIYIHTHIYIYILILIYTYIHILIYKKRKRADTRSNTVPESLNSRLDETNFRNCWVPFFRGQPTVLRMPQGVSNKVKRQCEWIMSEWERHETRMRQARRTRGRFVGVQVVFVHGSPCTRGDLLKRLCALLLLGGIFSVNFGEASKCNYMSDEDLKYVISVVQEEDCRLGFSFVEYAPNQDTLRKELRIALGANRVKVPEHRRPFLLRECQTVQNAAILESKQNLWDPTNCRRNKVYLKTRREESRVKRERKRKRKARRENALSLGGSIR